METKTPRSQTASKAAKPSFSQRLWREFRGYAEALAVAFLIVTFVFNTVGVVGSSMRPNLDGGPGSQNLIQSIFLGDRVFIPKYDTWLRRAGLLGNYQRGDIVVVREPANSPTAQLRERRPFFIKRVIGVPGDHVRIEAGNVVINGMPLDQSFITATGEIRPDPIDFPVVTQQRGQIAGMVLTLLTTRQGTAYPELPLSNIYPNPVPVSDPRVQLFYGPMLASMATIPENVPENEAFILDLVVPEGQYFVMGDNRQSSKGGSEDSRYFGAIRSITIGGKATAVIWPPRRNGEWNWRSLPPPNAFRSIPDSPLYGAR